MTDGVQKSSVVDILLLFEWTEIMFRSKLLEFLYLQCHLPPSTATIPAISFTRLNTLPFSRTFRNLTLYIGIRFARSTKKEEHHGLYQTRHETRE